MSVQAANESDISDELEEKNDCNEEEVKQNEVPGELLLKDEVFDVAFHPVKNYIATAEISGRVNIFSYSTEENKKLLELKHHKKACRCLSFSTDGNRLYTCSKDKSIHAVDMNTGAMIHSINMAHKKAVNSMQVLSENYMATGSDDGCVKVWDTRTFSTIAEFSERKDYISDMACDKENRHLLCTSGDGVLSIYNLRKKQLEQASDQLDEELLSVAIIKNGQKVVCGSADGTLNIYSWGEWGDISDRIPSQSDSIDAICKISEDIICTGADDGCIRSLSLQPHQALGLVGKHGTFGIENLKLSSDLQLMASCSGENSVKFWDISSLHERTVEPVQQKKKQRKRKMEETVNSKDEFFADL